MYKRILFVASFFVAACDATVNVNVSKNGASNNTTNGGCLCTASDGSVTSSTSTGGATDNSSGSCGAGDYSLLDFDVSFSDLRGKDVPSFVADGSACVESISNFNVTGIVDTLTPSTTDADSCKGVGPQGTMNIGVVTVSDKTPKSKIAPLTLDCSDLAGDLSNKADLQDKLTQCLQRIAPPNSTNTSSANLETVRKMFNGGSRAIQVTGNGGCSDGACFHVTYHANMKFQAKVNIAKNCN